MNLIATYDSIRETMRPGDIISFDGQGFVSNAISFFTGCPVSHIGVVHHKRDDQQKRRVILMESTTLLGKAGVQFTLMSQRVKYYDGRMWWLPLSGENRAKFDIAKFMEMATEVNGRKYDTRSIAHFFFDRLRLWSNAEDPSRLFCSELAALLLKAAGILPIWFNSSDFRPHDLVDLKIYGPNTYQLKGPEKEIPCFNRLPLKEWRNR